MSRRKKTTRGNPAKLAAVPPAQMNLLDLLDDAEPAGGGDVKGPQVAAPAVQEAPKLLPKRVRPFRRVDQFALAEAISETWHRQHISSGMEVPVGAVALLALIRQRDADGPDLGKQILDLSPGVLLDLLRRIRALTWIHAPYLVHCMWHIHAWLDQDPPERVVKAVHQTVRTAVKKGLLELTGDADPAWRCQFDVLGHLVSVMRSKGSRQGLGEYHTPADISDLIADMLMGDADPVLPKAGQRFADPAAGTGGLLRAAALRLWNAGRDPADYAWGMSELDPIAAACCAANAIVWGLGPDVLVACGDTLAEGDGMEEAARVRDGGLRLRDDLADGARFIAAIKQAERLLAAA